MSGWVKFIDNVPEASRYFGFNIQGNMNNDWIAGMVPNEWKWISQVGPVVPGGDGNHVIYIYDNMTGPQQVEMSDMELELFTNQPEARAYN